MFFIDPHLLECWVVENVCGASVVDQDPICVIVSYSDANDKRIVMWVVKMLSIFFRESNDGVVYPCYLWYGTCQLDVLNHPEVSFPSLFG